MAKKSAGIILYRFNGNAAEVLLVHPGGPYWQHKDAGVWSIPKGEFDDNEQALDAAIRELKEETGISANGDFIELQPVKMKSGKMIYAWALMGDADATQITSNMINIEWPPKSGRQIEIPEVDKAGWFELETAKQKLSASQIPLIEQLAEYLRP